MSAIDIQGLAVASFCWRTPLLVPVNVANVPDSMSEPKRVAICTIDGGRFYIMAAGNVVMLQVSLDLAKRRKGLCQRHLVVSSTADVNGLLQVPLRIDVPIFPARLPGLFQEML